MGKIRKTKTELKSQRDALERYEKYLPTLELKKQQLRSEVNHLNARIEKKVEQIKNLWKSLSSWIRMFSDEEIDIATFIELKDVTIETDNIAGVSVPMFKGAEFSHAEIDLYSTPPWVDDGLAVVEQLVQLEIEKEILETARTRLNEELRITSQRVNLFEKIKIPEAQENIRTIRIYLGDQQTAAVARAKIAKKKQVEAHTAS